MTYSITLEARLRQQELLNDAQRRRWATQARRIDRRPSRSIVRNLRLRSASRFASR